MSIAQPKKAYRGLAMEGLIARWYARNTGRNIEEFKKAAQEIVRRVPSGSDVLEVAPGPRAYALRLLRFLVGLGGGSLGPNPPSAVWSRCSPCPRPA